MRPRSLFALLALSLAACGGGSDDGGLGPGDDGGLGDTSGGGGDTGARFDVGNTDGGLHVDALDSTTSDALGDACIGVSSEATLVPLDINVMFDQSGSMSDKTSSGATKWDAVKSAFESFLGDPASAGLGVGIQYFAFLHPGVPATCTTATDCAGFGPCAPPTACDKESLAAGTLVPCTSGADCKSGGSCVPYGTCAASPTNACFTGANCGPLGPCKITSMCQNRESCSASDYATPEVEIAPLPGVATAIEASLAAHSPSTDTPTGPALKGAIDHATAWKTSNPTHAVVVLLVTDGLPTACSPQDIPSIAKFASDAFAATPSIRTYVIGVLGTADAGASTNLDTISKAGNGGPAFIVSTTSDVTKDFLAALTAIRGTALACEYTLPASVGADYFKVNVKVTLGGTTTTIPYVGDASKCDPSSGGWYYDVDPSAGTPTKIVMCPATCSSFKATTGGSIDIEVGCKTVTVVK